VKEDNNKTVNVEQKKKGNELSDRTSQFYSTVGARMQQRGSGQVRKKKKHEMIVRNPANGFIPFLIEQNKKTCLLLLLKIIIVIGLIGMLIYFIAVNIVLVNNQGGTTKAIFWIILAVMALLEYYVVFLPLLSFVKTALLFKWGNYNARQAKCSSKYLLYSFFISDLDRGIMKELIECVKNNNTGHNIEEKIVTSGGKEDENSLDETMKEKKEEPIKIPDDRFIAIRHDQVQEKKEEPEIKSLRDDRSQFGFDEPSSNRMLQSNMDKSVVFANEHQENLEGHNENDESIQLTNSEKDKGKDD
jgi:hypothetical protein